jgi:hypothetical protein
MVDATSRGAQAIQNRGLRTCVARYPRAPRTGLMGRIVFEHALRRAETVFGFCVTQSRQFYRPRLLVSVHITAVSKRT